MYSCNREHAVYFIIETVARSSISVACQLYPVYIFILVKQWHRCIRESMVLYHHVLYALLFVLNRILSCYIQHLLSSQSLPPLCYIYIMLSCLYSYCVTCSFMTRCTNCATFGVPFVAMNVCVATLLRVLLAGAVGASLLVLVAGPALGHQRGPTQWHTCLVDVSRYGHTVTCVCVLYTYWMHVYICTT
jgi:hypothetical protein